MDLSAKTMFQIHASQEIASSLMEAPQFNDHVTLVMAVPRGYPRPEPDCVSANLALSHPLILARQVSLHPAPLRETWTVPQTTD